MERRIGPHLGIYKDDTIKHFERDIKTVKKFGGNIIQLYGPQLLKLKKDELKNIRKISEKENVYIVVHGSYNINLCKDKDINSLDNMIMIDELSVSDYIKSKYYVIHFGKRLDKHLNVAYNNMYVNLVNIVNMRKYSTKILLETSAGEGTSICYLMKDLYNFYKKIKAIPILKENIGICLDTCHVFSAGYCIDNISMIKKFFDDFNDKIGINHIELIHLNDAQKKCGSRVDRHESIGKGYIGKEGLRYIYNKYKNIPMILETKGDSYKWEIELLNKV